MPPDEVDVLIVDDRPENLLALEGQGRWSSIEDPDLREGPRDEMRPRVDQAAEAAASVAKSTLVIVNRDDLHEQAREQRGNHDEEEEYQQRDEGFHWQRPL